MKEGFKTKEPAEIAKKYDQLWGDGASLYIGGQVAKDFFEFSRPFEGMKVLDVACGSGTFFECNKNFLMSAWGIDCSKIAIAEAKKRFPDGNFQVGWADQLPYKDNFFDRVYCLGSLEHFLDMEKALKEMIRVLKWGGRILLQVPRGDVESGTVQPLWRVMSKDKWDKLFISVGLGFVEYKELPAAGMWLVRVV